MGEDERSSTIASLVLRFLPPKRGPTVMCNFSGVKGLTSTTCRCNYVSCNIIDRNGIYDK